MAMHWYVGYTYAGFEERARQSLRERITQLAEQDRFGEIAGFLGGSRPTRVAPRSGAAAGG